MTPLAAFSPPSRRRVELRMTIPWIPEVHDYRLSLGSVLLQLSEMPWALFSSSLSNWPVSLRASFSLLEPHLLALYNCPPFLCSVKGCYCIRKVILPTQWCKTYKINQHLHSIHPSQLRPMERVDHCIPVMRNPQRGIVSLNNTGKWYCDLEEFVQICALVPL